MQPIRRPPTCRTIQRNSKTGVRVAWTGTPGAWPVDRNLLSDSSKLPGNAPGNETSASRPPNQRSVTSTVHRAAFAHLKITSSSSSPAEMPLERCGARFAPGAGVSRRESPAAEPFTFLIVVSQPLHDQAAQRFGWPSRPHSATRQHVPMMGLHPQSARFASTKWVDFIWFRQLPMVSRT